MPDRTGLAAVLANTQTNVGYVIVGVVVIGFVAYLFINARKAKAEVGSEIELAPNRKPYHDDEELETRVLDGALRWALVLLVIIGVALPLYWLNEPGRQSGADENYRDTFVARGEELYNAGANCAACHGPEGVGGVAPYSITDDTGAFVAQVEWQAPALDTVLFRYSTEEVTSILQYGRPFSPMPAWGEEGGGPLTSQQIRDIVLYLEEIQLPADEVRESVEAEIDRSLEAGEFATPGEAMFNLGYESGFQGGAFSCGRCHTEGWSYGDAGVPGGGWYGPAINDGRSLRQFPLAQGQVDFVSEGAETGKRYGQAGFSLSGAMPGFGVNPNLEDPDTTLSEDQVMYTHEQIEAIVDYERGL